MLGKPGIDFQVKRRAAGEFPTVCMRLPRQPAVIQQEFQRQHFAALRQTPVTPICCGKYRRVKPLRINSRQILGWQAAHVDQYLIQQPAMPGLVRARFLQVHRRHTML